MVVQFNRRLIDYFANKTCVGEVQDKSVTLEPGFKGPNLGRSFEASQANRRLATPPGPILIAQAMPRRRQMRAYLRGVDEADLVNWRLTEVANITLINAKSQPVTDDNLPAGLRPEGQATNRAPVKRGEGELTPLVHRSEVGTCFVSPDRRDDRIPTPVIAQMIDPSRSHNLLRLHRTNLAARAPPIHPK